MIYVSSESSTYQHGQTVFYQDAETRPLRAFDSSHDCTTSPFGSDSAISVLANIFDGGLKGMRPYQAVYLMKYFNIGRIAFHVSLIRTASEMNVISC